VDYGPSREYEVHRFCAAQGVYHLENVANLDAVPEAGATAIVLPMKLENGSGAPVRILAMVRD
jgi:kynurenine formamidase